MGAEAPWYHLKAGLLLILYGVFGTLGTPGLNYIPDNKFDDADERANLAEQPGGSLAMPIVAFNHYVRTPLAKLFNPIQRPFRISQQWNLYDNGPGRLHRLEIRIDGKPVYRSVDAELNWLQPQLRYRRIRPMVEATVESPNPGNWRGLTRFVIRRALQDFPDAHKVELIALVGAYPGTEPLTVSKTMWGEAPLWDEKIDPPLSGRGSKPAKEKKP